MESTGREVSRPPAAAAAAPLRRLLVILEGRRVEVRSFSESMASAARRDELRFGCSVALLCGRLRDFDFLSGASSSESPSSMKLSISLSSSCYYL